jgi:hypothetical protein
VKCAKRFKNGFYFRIHKCVAKPNNMVGTKSLVERQSPETQRLARWQAVGAPALLAQRQSSSESALPSPVRYRQAPNA